MIDTRVIVTPTVASVENLKRLPKLRQNKERLRELGIIRYCSNCDFETNDRKDWRQHERQNPGHTQANKPKKVAQDLEAGAKKR